MGDFIEFLLFAVPITALVGGAIYVARRKIDRLRIELAEERGSNRTAQIATEKTALEERVRVLERIVTPRGYTDAEEIEALRDLPPSAADVQRDIPLNLDRKEQA